MVSDPSFAVRAAAIQSAAELIRGVHYRLRSGTGPRSRTGMCAARSRRCSAISSRRTPPCPAVFSHRHAGRAPAHASGSFPPFWRSRELHAPGANNILLDRLKVDDSSCARPRQPVSAKLKPASGCGAGCRVNVGRRDATGIARAAAVAAIRSYGREAAVPLLRDALADKDWAVRRRAAQALQAGSIPSGDVQALIRPAPSQLAAATYSDPHVVDPVGLALRAPSYQYHPRHHRSS